jgi:hypothetical protein
MLVWTPFFETNDDVWMMLNVSGRAFPEPTEYVFWMNVVLTRLLVRLYRFTGDVPWYGLLHALVLSSGLAAVGYALLLRAASLRRFTLWAVALLLLGVPLAVQWQFTRTAALGATAGVFLATATLSGGTASAGRMVARLGAAASLLLLGYVIRPPSFWLVLLVLSPLILFLAWTGGRARAWSAGLVVVTGTLVAALSMADARAYADPEWVRFRELNRLKSLFLDFRAVPFDATTRSALAAVGWSETDYHLLMRWFYVDPEVHSPEKLAAVAERARRDGPSVSQRLASGVRGVLGDVGGTPGAWIAGALLLGTALIGVRRPAALATLVSTVAMAIGVAVVLHGFAKLPLRVFEPMLVAVAWLALLLGGDPALATRPGRRDRAAKVVGFSLVGLALLLGLAHPGSPLRTVGARSRQAVQANDDLKGALQRIGLEPWQTVVVVGGTFPYESILPMPVPDYLRDVRLVAVAASNQSPVQRRLLAVRGISDLPRALFERDDVLITIYPEAGDDRLLERYIAEHYRVPVKVVPWRHEGPVRLWKVTRVVSDLADERARPAR